MLHALAAARSSKDIWWLHGARRRADEPFAAESRALLAALVMVETFSDGKTLVLDARAGGMAAAAIALALRASLPVTVIVAAAVAAGLRLVA